MNTQEYVKYLENEIKRIKNNIIKRDAKKIIGAFINGDSLEDIAKYFDLDKKDIHNFLVKEGIIDEDKQNSDYIFEMEF